MISSSVEMKMFPFQEVSDAPRDPETWEEIAEPIFYWSDSGSGWRKLTESELEATSDSQH